MIKQIIILIIIGLAIFGGITLVTGESIGEFELGQDVQLFQTCNNCTFCDFPRLMGLNNRSILSNLSAAQDGSFFFYDIESENFTEIGEFQYTYNCGNGVENSTGVIDFEVTYTGGDLTLPIAIIYGMGMAFLIFIFILNILLISRLPDKDSTDEEGTILKLSELKHFRKVLWGVAWGLVLAMLFLISNISLAFLPTAMFGNLFFVLYRFMFYATMVAVPLLFIWIFAGIFRDKEVKRLMERGVDMKSL